MGICVGICTNSREYMYSLSKGDDLLNTIPFRLIVKLLHRKCSYKKD